MSEKELEESLAARAAEISAEPAISEERERKRRAKEEALSAIHNLFLKVKAGEATNGELDRLREALELFREAQGKIKTWSEATGAELLDSKRLIAIKDEPIPYLLDPLAIRGSLTQIYGPTKGGKSVFTLYLGIAGAFGHLPEGPVSIPESFRVLYLGWEDQAPLMARRACSYSAGLGMGWTIPENFTFSYAPDLWLDLKGHADVLERLVVERKFDLVILDTFSYAHMANEDKATEIKPVMANMKRIARNTKAAIWYVHHRTKAQDGRSMSEKARGSSAISAAADVLLDWGDRGDSNVTPVDVLSKWGRSGKWEVEYFPQEDGSIKWDIRERGKTKRRDEKIDMVVETVSQLKKNQADVSGNQIAIAMIDQGVSKRSVYNYLRIAVEKEKLAFRVVGTSTFYDLPSTIMQPQKTVV